VPCKYQGHAIQDRISLEFAIRTVARLKEDPSLLELARGNLGRRMTLNKNAPGLVRCYQEWLDIIDENSLEEVCRILTQLTDEGQRLRQNSPFCGILSQEEVLAIKAGVRDGSIP